MLRTYKAKLRGNRLEWIEAPPQIGTTAEAVDVHVTILDQSNSSSDAPAQGARMEDILAQLAQR
jgi:hypothetical protein